MRYSCSVCNNVINIVYPLNSKCAVCNIEYNSRQTNEKDKTEGCSSNTTSVVEETELHMPNMQEKDDSKL